MIGGFIIGGNQPAKVLVRAIGPSLPVSGKLDDTVLKLHDANGASITNDNWRETQEADVTATTIPPSSEKESSIVATLVPGNYTAVVRGKNNTTGVRLGRSLQFAIAAAGRCSVMAFRVRRRPRPCLNGQNPRRQRRSVALQAPLL